MSRAKAAPKAKPTITRATKTADAKREAEAAVTTLLTQIRTSLYPPTTKEHEMPYILTLSEAQALTLYSLLGQLRQANLSRRLALEVQGLYDLVAALDLPKLDILTTPATPSTDDLAELMELDLADYELADLC